MPKALAVVGKIEDSLSSDIEATGSAGGVKQS